jgi:hypothetical protein
VIEDNPFDYFETYAPKTMPVMVMDLKDVPPPTTVMAIRTRVKTRANLALLMHDVLDRVWETYGVGPHPLLTLHDYHRSFDDMRGREDGTRYFHLRGSGVWRLLGMSDVVFDKDCPTTHALLDLRIPVMDRWQMIDLRKDQS